MYAPSLKLKKNGVPYLTKEKIDAIAEEFIAYFNSEALVRPIQIDIDSFVVNYLGMKQDFQYLSHNGIYLGMVVFNDTNKVPVYVPETSTAEYIHAEARTVIIDSTLLDEGNEHRYRYTMGHECAHYILHSSYYAKDKNQLPLVDDPEPLVQCREAGFIYKPVELWDDKDRMEWQANYFSSAILMPKSMVHKLMASLPPYHELLNFVNYIHEMVMTFNVSYQAAENRLRSLGIKI